MDLLHTIFDKLKTFWRFLCECVSRTLNAAFPETERKYGFLVLVGVFELLLAYAIAILDIGISRGEWTIPGIIASYWLSDRSYPLGSFFLLSAILLIFLYYYLSKKTGDTGRGFDIAESNVYGSAREINLEELHEVADICPKEEAMGTILGQLDKSETKLICNKPISNANNNSIVFGPPGSGKTFVVVLNYIMQAIRRGESVITTDTKGEIFAKTVEAARAHGYTIRRFDIKDPDHSDGWAILSEIRMNNVRSMLVSEIIMANSKTDKDTDPHVSSEEALLVALCQYVAYNDAIPEEEKTLYRAFTMLSEGIEALDKKFAEIQYDPTMSMAYESYATAFKNGSPNLRTNIVSNLSNRLRILSDPAIREMTSTPDIDLEMPGQRPCIYYVEMPDQHHFGKFLASLFFSFAFLDLTDFADKQIDQKLPVPVNVMCEEAYAIGKLPTITNALATVRSRGIAITMIVQGLSQLLELYGPNMTEIILECCGTYICLSSNTRGTSELFEWLSGNATVDIQTEQHQHGEIPLAFGRRYSTGYGRQALYSSNDVRKIKRGRLLIVWQRFDPIMAYTFGIDRHIEYLAGRMPVIHANTNVPLRDTKARNFMREKEEERIAAYNKWILDGGNPWKDYKKPKPKFNGPSRKKPAPEIIPYPELERMALEYSNAATKERENAILHEIQTQPPIPPMGGFEPIYIPDDIQWIETDPDEDLEDLYLEEEDPVWTKQGDTAEDSDTDNSPNDDNSTKDVKALHGDDEAAPEGPTASHKESANGTPLLADTTEAPEKSPAPTIDDTQTTTPIILDRVNSEGRKAPRPVVNSITDSLFRDEEFDAAEDTAAVTHPPVEQSLFGKKVTKIKRDPN